MTAIDFMNKFKSADVTSLALPVVDMDGNSVSVVFDTENMRFVIYKSHINGKNYELVPAKNCDNCSFIGVYDCCRYPSLDLSCMAGLIYKKN